MTVREYVEDAKRMFREHKQTCHECQQNNSRCKWFFNLCMSVKYFGKTPPEYLKETLKQFYGPTEVLTNTSKSPIHHLIELQERQ